MGTDFAGLDSGFFPPSSPELQSSRIAGTWRRLFAFAIDSLLVGIFGAVIGTLLFETLVQMGEWARLIGLMISLLYFGFSESAAGGGRSLGKRLLGLRLTNAQGGILSFEEASLRFLVFGIPFLANGLSLPLTHGATFFTTVMGLVIFGLGGANLYLVLFNRPMHQGLHDMVVKSYVVYAHPEGAVAHRSVWKGHWTVLGIYALLLCTLPFFILPKILKSGSFPQMMEDLRCVQGIQGVQNAAVHEVKVFHGGAQTSDRVFSIEVTWTGPEGNEEAVADQIAKDMLLNDKDIANYSKLRIAITRGYDLGIGSRWYSRAFAYSPEEWRQRLL